MHNVLKRTKRILMRTRSGAEGYLAQILPKINVILEIWIIKQMNCSTFFFAEGLFLSQSIRRASVIVKVTEFLESRLDHLRHGEVATLLIH